MEAARAGNIAWLNRWLRAGGDPDVRDQDGWTPLLGAASRGQRAVVELLLEPGAGLRAADPELRLEGGDLLPLHLAAQAGHLPTVRRLLAARPAHLNAISRVNGHTLLLQCAFFGRPPHREVLRWLLEEGIGLAHPEADAEARALWQRRLQAGPNVRGYTARRMSVELYDNQEVVRVLDVFPQPSQEEVASAYQELLLLVASPEQRATRLIDAIERALAAGAGGPGTPDALERLAEVDRLLAFPGLDPNQRGGALMQPPLVHAVTGVDADPRVAALRVAIVERLLAHGADPVVRELHPMAVGAVIRSAVLGRFDLLQLLAAHMPPRTFTDEMNVRPAINGLTALHDTVHRSLTASAERFRTYHDQLRFMLALGARPNLPDHTGLTQRDLAVEALSDTTLEPGRAAQILALLDSRGGDYDEGSRSAE